MRIKNFSLSLLVISSLIVLSFAFYIRAQENSSGSSNIFLDSDQDGLTDEEEKTYKTNPKVADTDKDGYSDGAEVRSGYDPLKPAPGDKISTSSSEVLGTDTTKTDTMSQEENMTEEVAKKISDLANNAGEDEEISLQEITDMVSQTISEENATIELPEISEKDIKIKKQNYSSFSEEKQKEKKKEDFANYITAVFYIISSNSPKPLTSAQDITSITSSVVQDIATAMENHDPEKLDALSKSGEKITEQLKELEVPEDVVSIHIKSLSYALYAQNLKKYISLSENDPLKDISNLSKIEGFIESLTSFSEEAKAKFEEYGLSYDDAVIKEKLESYGMEEIDQEELTKLLKSMFSSSSEE